MTSEKRSTPGSELRALRDAFGCFATGVTVVTVRQADGVPRGFTANSFSSVSLDPPLLLICIAKSAHSCETFAKAETFAVSILAEDQKATSGLFASRAPDKFDQTAWHEGPGGVPLIEGSLCTFACKRHQLVDAGDHLVLIGRVVAHEIGDKPPLGYFRGQYFSIGHQERLVEAAGQSGVVRIGAILQQDRQVLLRRAADDRFDLPAVGSAGASLETLWGRLSQAGLIPQLGHLYAVYRDSDSGIYGIYYHGHVTGTPGEKYDYHDLDTLPLASLAQPAEASMLARYREESRYGGFGIYQGDETEGMVHKVSSQITSRI